MKALLFNCVPSDERDFVAKAMETEFEIIEASSFEEARIILDKEEVDIVFMSTNLLDVIEKNMLNYLSDNFPNIRVVINLGHVETEPTVYIRHGLYSSKVENIKFKETIDKLPDLSLT